jgi:hypothetical protein
LKGGVLNIGLCNLFVLRGGVYITKCYLGLGFFFKFNVVVGYMWFEVIEKNKKTSGLKRERLERSNPLKTSRFLF